MLRAHLIKSKTGNNFQQIIMDDSQESFSFRVHNALFQQKRMKLSRSAKVLSISSLGRFWWLISYTSTTDLNYSP